MSPTKPTPDFGFLLPQNLRGPEDALAMARLYGRKRTPAKQLRQLEEQTVFWLLHELLNNPEHEVVEVSLGVPDGPDELISVDLVFMIDGEREEDSVYEPDAEVGGELFAFLQGVNANPDSDFIQGLAEPATKETLWVVARKIFSSKAYAGIKEAALERGLPIGTERSAKPPRF